MIPALTRFPPGLLLWLPQCGGEFTRMIGNIRLGRFYRWRPLKWLIGSREKSNRIFTQSLTCPTTHLMEPKRKWPDKRRPKGLLREAHGMRQSPEYGSWAAMRRRCLNPTDPKYPIYGARGITICPEWKWFSNFIRDMGRRPGKVWTLGRIDNNGNYCPENCRWETAKQQARNTRFNRFIECDGVKKTVVEWAEQLKVHPDFLYCRLNKLGWSDERTIKQPKSYRGN